MKAFVTAFLVIAVAFLLITGAGAVPVEDGMLEEQTETLDKAMPEEADNELENQTEALDKAIPEEADDVLKEQTEALDKAMPEEADRVLGNLDPADPDSGEKGLKSLLKELSENAIGFLKIAIATGLKLLVVVCLCSVACSMLDDGGVKDAINFATAAAVSIIAAGDLKSFFTQGVNVLYELSDFSRALLPAMCAAAAGAGAVTSASIKYAASALFMDLLITVGISVILPLISIYLASVIAGAALGKENLAGVSNFLKWVCTTGLTLLVMAFTAYLGLSGLIAGKADQVSAKVAKTALGTFLPVVGGMLSNAAETFVAGAGMLRNTMGIVGLLAVAAVCLSPIMTIGAHYLVYKGTAALTNALTDKRLSELIDGIGTAFGLILGLIGTVGLILFISVISSMKAVVG